MKLKSNWTPPNITEFLSLNFNEKLITNINNYGYLIPTKQQLSIITSIQSNQSAFLIHNQGLEKFVGYSIPLINKLIEEADCDSNSDKNNNPKVLILLPLRGLAQQLKVVINQLTKGLDIASHSCFGGTSIRDDKLIFENDSIDIVIGTVGRIFDLVQRNILNLESLEVLVIDELDELISFGFGSLIDELMSKLCDNIQIIVLSTTIAKEIENFVEEKLKDPIIIINDDDQAEEGFK